MTLTLNATVNRDAIVDAALRVIARDGADALSMRSLATEMGLSLSAAYRYVEGREEIDALVIDRVFSDLPEGAWSIATLLSIAAAALRRYPGLAASLHGSALKQPHVAAWLTKLEDAVPADDLRPARVAAALWLVRGAGADPDAPTAALDLLGAALGVPESGRNQNDQEGR